MRHTRRFLGGLLFVVVAGCGDDGGSVDSGAMDGGPSTDATVVDSGPADSGPDDGGTDDASVRDAGVPDASTPDASTPDGGACDIDEDGDGDPACTDCDDTDPRRHHGATDLCGDLIDNDCNGVVDDALVVYYADCDGDDWADVTAPTFSECRIPEPELTGCETPTQRWTTRTPEKTAYDCADDVADVHGAATEFHAVPLESARYFIPFDYDCDYDETPEYPALGGCVAAGDACTTTLGWQTLVPTCGASGTFVRGCTAGCVPETESRVQRCR